MKPIWPRFFPPILALFFVVFWCAGCLIRLTDPQLAAVDHTAAAGAVIESVQPGGVGEAAGLQPGDVILSWSCPASPPAFPQSSSGSIHSPYDLLPLQTEEAPRRAVNLRGKRGDLEMTWTLAIGGWGIASRPVLPADLAALYLEGKKRVAAGDLAAAERSWRSAAEFARDAGESRLAAWFVDRLARELAEAGSWPDADAAYGEALEALEREPDIPAAAHLLRKWGVTFERRAAWDEAIERYQGALALYRRAAAESLATARTLSDLGVAFAKRGDYPAAEDFLRQALAIQEKLAPGTTEVTSSLNNLGILARHRGDLTRAEEYLTRGEESLRRLAPGSADHALFFQNLGNLAMDRGDLEKAASFHRQALAIFEKTAPGGDGVAGCLHNLANVARLRGDLVAAEDLLRRVLALGERRAPNELGFSAILVGLGAIAERRGDLEAAKAHYRRALAIQEKIAPAGVETAQSLHNLGNVLALQGNFAMARTYLQRSLAILEELAPGTLGVAASLENLGRLETNSGGDLATAEGLLRRSLTIYQNAASESLEVAEILRDLGEVASRRGRLAEALVLHRRAWDLQHKLAPESTGEAEALYFLGRAELRTGQLEEGTHDLCRAITVLDRQRGRIGGTQEARTSFEATVGGYYQACLDGLIELGRPAEAFHALERGRARSFLALLADRDLRLSGLPPDLDAERRHTNAEYDRVQSQLASLSSGRDDAEIERLTGRLHDLRTRQEDITARIRQVSHRSAAIEDPEPLDLSGARTALDPGTVLLAYAVGSERSWLFVVSSAGAAGPGLSVFPISTDAKALREEVESFRRLLTSPESDREAIQERARRLYSLLVQPAGAQIAKAQRILISPAGPLHTLPFAALLRNDRWLGEWKPIHSVLSTTVYAELVQSRPARRNPEEERLAAFGDPLYPAVADAPSDPEVRDFVRRGLSLQSLPSTRQEVEAITALYPQAQVYLGREATEASAKSLGMDSRLVHFACHGLLDERFPLNSGLALTIPEHSEEGRDNGLLQAWEIFESVRLDADLVTLSACDSGLGQEMGGEGMIGLVRAFQFAGARSVLASLWSVADDSTATLMKRFYTHLRQGKTKDEALRAAQLDLIRSENLEISHPYHWAGFSLYGDWR